MKKGKKTVEPLGMEALSTTVEKNVWDRLNEAAKEEGRSKASIIRIGLIAWLDNRDRQRGAS